ncbi:cyanamide hydratase, partial [Rathayibacter sp. AY2B7]|uniref:HD domain-containing protein n=1 Tax=Rathayibacter sp. AY2B7 TaxID=2080571 RepID=UPI000D4F5FAA
MDYDHDLTIPPTATAAAARDVVQRWASPALVNHCLRSYIWAVLRAQDLGVDYDRELLYVAAMLHDLGTTAQFDAASVPFEDAGGSVGWVFAAGAGWPPERRDLVREIIQQHAW